MSNLKYAVVGAGAVGSIIGALPALGGAEVWFVDPFEAHMRAIAEHGLKIRKGTYADPENCEELRVRVHAVTEPEPVGKADVIILLVKSTFTESAVPTVRALYREGTIILTLQNGLGNVELLEENFPGGCVACGVTTISSMVLEPGYVRSMFPPAHDIYIGSTQEALRSRLEEICSDFRAGGSDCSYAEDILRRVWTKVAMNCSVNPIMGILRLNARRANTFEEYLYLSRKVLEEIHAVAGAKGIHLDPKETGMYRRAMPYETSTSPDNYPSTAQDIKSHRKTEIAFLNGAIVREGLAAGVPTPYNDAITQLVTILENSYEWQF